MAAVLHEVMMSLQRGLNNTLDYWILKIGLHTSLHYLTYTIVWADGVENDLSFIPKARFSRV